MGLTVSEWSAHMAGNIAHLNARLLEAVDAILHGRADATIVLVSDHGGRYDSKIDEWRKILLIARTPGKERLFSANPRPDGILTALGFRP